MINVYKLFLEYIPWPTWIETIDSEIIFLNPAYEDVYQVRLSDVKGKTNREAFSKEIAENYDSAIKKCLEKKEPLICEACVREAFLECHMFPIFNSAGEIGAIAGIILDITSKKEKELEVENQKGILRTIIDALPEAIFYKDKDSKFLGYNKAFEDYYTDLDIHDIIGHTDLEIYPDKEVAEEFIANDQEVMRSKKAKHFEQTIREDNEQIRVEENIKIPVLGANGEAWGVVGLSRNITRQKALEDKLRYLSQIDILTGLYNRHSFEEKIKLLNKERYLPLGIIMGDVNGLKLVNDTLGHLEGDDLLKDMAKVLKDTCSTKGDVFRWGGDEFMVLLPCCNEAQCERVVDEINLACKAYDKNLIQLSISLGSGIKTSLEENIYACIRKVEEKVYRQKLLKEKSMKSSILDTLKKSLEEKNMETTEHTDRVVEYAVAVGKMMGFKIAELDELTLAAELHDIGKIAVPEELLLKPGRLTEEEFELLKTHTEKGYRIIQASGELSNVAKSVLTHHERWDGKGYPLGLKGEEIPLMARIINVVDAYDVMMTERPYKRAMTHQEAMEELQKCMGTQFDPEVVQKFVTYLNNQTIS